MDIKNMIIVSIDDNTTNLLIVENYAKALGLVVESFDQPSKGIERLQKGQYDLVIVDYMMPDIDGLEVIKYVRNFDQDVPIIMLTAIGDDVSLQVTALELGATDFLGKPVNAPTFKARIRNLLQLRQSQVLLKNKALLLEEEVRKATLAIVQREQEALVVLGKISEFKDPETSSHVARVSHYARLLAEQIGLNKRLVDIIFFATPFHDIGKVGIPDAILLKPGPLSVDEMEVMKTHATIGLEILKHTKSDYLKAGGVISFTHHEKYDGTGYPKGLKGEGIPIFGRIVALADVFDALTTKRPYKAAWDFDSAVAHIKSQSGKHFDPQLVAKFIESLDEIKEIFTTIQDE